MTKQERREREARADKFMWKDGDLKILYNPNDTEYDPVDKFSDDGFEVIYNPNDKKKKPIYTMAGAEWEQELLTAAHTGENDEE